MINNYLSAKIFVAVVIVLLISSCTTKNPDVNLGLVAHYTFNGNAHDNKNINQIVKSHATILTTDRFGNKDSAYAFDGLESNILINISNIPSIESIKTISWWYYAESMPKYYHNLDAENMLVLVDSVSAIGIQFGFRAPGYKTKGFDSWEWGGGTFLDVEYPEFKKWHHCVYTYDGITHNFIIDNKQIASSTKKPKTGIPNMLMFGNYPGGNQSFKGKLDDVRIYNRVLNKSEISFLFKVK